MKRSRSNKAMKNEKKTKMICPIRSLPESVRFNPMNDTVNLIRFFYWKTMNKIIVLDDSWPDGSKRRSSKRFFYPDRKDWLNCHQWAVFMLHISDVTEFIFKQRALEHYFYCIEAFSVMNKIGSY